MKKKNRINQNTDNDFPNGCLLACALYFEKKKEKNDTAAGS